MSTKGIYFDNMLEPKSSESDNFKLFFSSKYGDFGSLFFPPKNSFLGVTSLLLPSGINLSKRKCWLYPGKQIFPKLLANFFYKIAKICHQKIKEVLQVPNSTCKCDKKIPSNFVLKNLSWKSHKDDTSPKFRN